MKTCKFCQHWQAKEDTDMGFCQRMTTALSPESMPPTQGAAIQDSGDPFQPKLWTHVNWGCLSWENPLAPAHALIGAPYKDEDEVKLAASLWYDYFRSAFEERLPKLLAAVEEPTEVTSMDFRMLLLLAIEYELRSMTRADKRQLNNYRAIIG